VKAERLEKGVGKGLGVRVFCTGGGKGAEWRWFPCVPQGFDALEVVEAVR
jgi:hypothetical protein